MLYVMNRIKKQYILDGILSAKDNPFKEKEAVGELVSFAIEHGLSGDILKKYIIYTLIYNENPYTRSIERGLKTEGRSSLILEDYRTYYSFYTFDAPYLNEVREFSFKRTGLEYLSGLIDDIYESIEAKPGFDGFMEAMESFYKTNGAGDMAVYRAFRVDDGVLKPIHNVLSVSFDDIIGYDLQKKQLRENTEAFLSKMPYNNVLLYGDSGTGKSTSIKAMLNTYFKDGLRIIEVYKHQMQEISKIIHTLKTRPYFYVIYMDDLSFEENEVEYKYLKSIIEGGIEPKPDNVVIYATSNRRHLIRENVQDNGGVFDDLHRNETQAEKLSLAYRFGLQIYYGSLSPDQFRAMVKEMAIKNNISMEEKDLIREASAWQMRYGTLCGRCAEQFVKYLTNKISKQA